MAVLVFIGDPVAQSLLAGAGVDTQKFQSQRRREPMTMYGMR